MNLELEALKTRLFGDNKVRNVKFFPGVISDASSDDIAREMNKAFAEAETGDHEALTAA